MKLPPVRTGGHERAREVPYMRYGHTAVLLDDIIYLWGGRNDTEGACNVLYAFDISKLTCMQIVKGGLLFEMHVFDVEVVEQKRENWLCQGAVTTLKVL